MLIEYWRLRELQHAVMTTKSGPSPSKRMTARFRMLSEAARRFSMRLAAAGTSEAKREELFTVTVTVSEQGRKIAFEPDPDSKGIAELAIALDSMLHPVGNDIVDALATYLFHEFRKDIFGEADVHLLTFESLQKLAVLGDALADRLEGELSSLAKTHLKSRSENAAMNYLVAWQEEHRISTRGLAKMLVVAKLEPGPLEQVRQRIDKAKRYRRDRSTRRNKPSA